jgi:hypothetical protein
MGDCGLVLRNRILREQMMVLLAVILNNFIENVLLAEFYS